MDQSPKRRNITLHTQSAFNKPDKFTSLHLTKSDKMFKVSRHSNKSPKPDHVKITYRQPPSRIIKTKYEELKKAKQIEEEYNQYERTMEKQRKYEASLKFLANQKKQEIMRRSNEMSARKQTAKQAISRLFVEEFNEFKEKKLLKPTNDWEQILLKVDKRKQQQVRNLKSKQLQPYQKLMTKFKDLNKQTYDHQNIQGINYCKGVKHQIRRTMSSSHLRTKSDRRLLSNQNVPTMRNQGLLKSSVIVPTKNIIEMCKDYTNYSRNLKKSMDGFEIYCERFNNILERKKAALLIEEL